MSSVVLDPPLLAIHHVHSPFSAQLPSPRPSSHDALSPPSTLPSEPMPATPQDDPEPRPATPPPANQQQICCANCGAVKTPLWRRDSEGKTVCNACGLYQKNRNTPRPTSLSRRGSQQPLSIAPTSSPSAPASLLPQRDSSAAKPGGTCPGDGRCDGTGGNSSCNGCPTFNNSLTHGTDQPPAEADVDHDSSGENRKPGGLCCANCKTSTTPLWRRDDVGNNICNACGLYFKLHGTHRPFSMKKAVIKRRKRVPAAASATPGRLSDQAAAEALVSVGRGMQSTEEDEGDADETQQQPKRKRARRDSAAGRSGRKAARSDDDGGSPSGAAPGWDTHPPHPHTGLDLPPLAHLMPQAEVGMFPYMVGAPGMFPKTMYHAVHSVPPPASSYMRSSSRAQSPSGVALPPPGVGGMFLTAGRISPASGLPAVPTIEEMQNHYRELDMQKRAMADMLERTERLMEGLKRGIESAGGASGSGSGSSVQHSLPPLAALDVPQDEMMQDVEREREQHEHSPHPHEHAHAHAHEQQEHEHERAPTGPSSPAPDSTSVSALVAVPLPRPSSAASARSPRESVWPITGGSSPRDEVA